MTTIPITIRCAEKLKEELQRLKSKDCHEVINAIADSRAIRTSALAARVTTFTTIFGAEAAVDGMKAMRAGALQVTSVQELHALLA